MKPDEYEKLVREVFQSLKIDLGKIVGEILNETIKNGLTNKKKGESGYSHQIDVSFECELKEIKTLFVIECKLWKSKIEPAQLLTLYGRVLDIRKNSKCQVIGIMASTQNYSKGVRVLQNWLEKESDIYLFTVVSPDDFSGKIKNRFFVSTSDTIGTSEAINVEIQ
ncbi:MAG TPA: hypothetical protein VMS73_04875 [Anaerolineaceae bacterium]|nr:hypothetical protein [Anaerolineaceae bacterium]